MKTAALFLLPGLLAAQVAAPNPGLVRFAGLPVQNVLGVPGNLLVLPSPFSAAEAIAFSDRFGLIASAGKIRLVQKNGTVLGQVQYQGSAPLLNIDRQPESAIAWLPSEQTILFWHNGQFERAQTNDVAGAVTAISLISPEAARLLTSNPDGTVSAVDISLPGGNTRNVALLPGVPGPAYVFGSFTLYRDQEGLEIEGPNGAKHALAAPAGPFHAERMSSAWIHLYFPVERTHYALHLTAEPTLSQLPVPAAKVAK